MNRIDGIVEVTPHAGPVTALSAWRSAKDATNVEIGELIDLSQPTVRKAIAGEKLNPAIVFKIAAKTGLPEAFIVDGKTRMRDHWVLNFDATKGTVAVVEEIQP